ncbi:MAG: hypothetical protein J0I20_18140 [Chloroflexi bacterium]|nr:hypothetical protein [Chloroflexota bacterium]OJV86843.1 MAG: hypothetical protein BGO39_13530 [Chloroflexi bacterium 54-19]
MKGNKFANRTLWLAGLGLVIVLGLAIGLMLAFSGPQNNPATTTSPVAANPTGAPVGTNPTGTTPAITNPPGESAVSMPVNPTSQAAQQAPGSIATVTPAPKADIKGQLDASWTDYSKRFIQADGRVMDPQQAALTTSEGQSYALLRAVWENDQATFKRVLSWTQSNLQTRGTDKLFAFKWGQGSDGQWHVLDKNSASDADSDIALALLFAAKTWGDDNYQKLGLDVLNSLWEKSVVTVNNKPYLTAGDWAVSQDRPALNPSYLAPYAYRIFAAFDRGHDWNALVDTSYEVIQGCSTATLDGQGGKNLPPNFCGINKKDGSFTTAQDYPSLNINYGYDAFRTNWRLALDYKWFGDKRDLELLKANSLPRDIFKQTGKLGAEYDHSGKLTNGEEDLAIYSGTLGNFIVTDPQLADTLVNSKLLPAYKNITDNDFARAFVGWGDTRNYYNQNWVWFGLALYSDNLPNLAANSVSTSK